MPILYLSEDDLRQSLTMADAVEALEATFAAIAQGETLTRKSFDVDLPEASGHLGVKAIYHQNKPYYIVKANNTFQPQNPQGSVSENDVTVLFETITGSPVAIISDKGYLSRMRSGATGALAAAYLAKKVTQQVTVLGASQQAFIHLKGLMTVRNIPQAQVVVWGRSPLKVDNFARRMVEDHDLNIRIAPSVEDAVRDADIIITATTSSEPILEVEWLKPGAHITAVGGDHASVRREIAPSVFQRADVVIVDNLSRSPASGELYHALNAGLFTLNDLHGDLGQVIIGQIPGRTSPDQITLADLTGLDTLCATIASLALEQSLFLNLGHRL